ncbi:hypothetical protein ACWEVO_18040, partial [Micromonospora sp. NPDC003776]
MMARRKRRPAEPAEELSVHELIDGPTQDLTTARNALAGRGGPEASRAEDHPPLSVEATQDLSALAGDLTQDLSGAAAAVASARPAATLSASGPVGPVGRVRSALPRRPAGGAGFR